MIQGVLQAKQIHGLGLLHPRHPPRDPDLSASQPQPIDPVTQQPTNRPSSTWPGSAAEPPPKPQSRNVAHSPLPSTNPPPPTADDARHQSNPPPGPRAPSKQPIQPTSIVYPPTPKKSDNVPPPPSRP